MTVAAELAEYAHDLEYGDLDGEAVEAAKTQLLDTLACAVAAFEEGAVERTRSYALERSGVTEARLLGTDETAPPEYAALANGAAIRFLDWNDTGISSAVGCGHPSDDLATVLAAVDGHDRSGAELVLGTVLAYEVHVGLCDALSLRRQGWDHVVYEVVAGALAAGRLMGLDVAELAEAVNIALAGHLSTYQSRTGALADWKGLAAANAARNAVVAADLAARGITGPNEMFEGRHGIFRQLAGGGTVDVDVDRFGGDGEPFAVTTSVFTKVHPIETHSQAAVECVRELQANHGVDPEGIESITCETYGDAVDEIGDDAKREPETRETADHSLPYIVARAFLDDELGPEGFTPEKANEPAARDLASKVTVTENLSFTEAYGESMPHAITVETERGTFEARVDRPRGHPDRPLTMGDVSGKFDRATSDALSASDRRAVREFVADVERRESLSTLYDRLVHTNWRESGE